MGFRAGEKELCYGVSESPNTFLQNEFFKTEKE
jgi:hypothetical protein